MVKIQLDMTAEDAIHTILGVISLVNGKTLLNGEKYFARHSCEDLGYKIIENELAKAAKALDLELFDGILTKDITWIEGSAE